MTRSGPYRIVALHCGKFDYAEIELDTPVHLIGPNNVGKTSLIALLQFLYIDDQRQMQFSRDMAETRRYYFPEKYSYALFECLTPTGFQVVGARGLGPVRQHEFERFVYNGRIELDDFLDADRRVREPEDTAARLGGVKQFRRLEPRHLRAAITGVGDNRGAYLGLVPARNIETYTRFRKVFGNILRLAHIRQDELKQLLLDVHGHEFQQREIDLARNYAAGFEQVRRDSRDVQELKLLQTDIERLLRHLERRDNARRVIPALWDAVGRMYSALKAEFDDRESALRAARVEIDAEKSRLNDQIDGANQERVDLARRKGEIESKLRRIEEQRPRFEGFVREWALQRQADGRARHEELVVQLRGVADEPVEQVKKRLRDAEHRLAAMRIRLDNLTASAVCHLRHSLSDREIVTAFAVLNPEMLALPVNTDKPGLRTPDDAAAAALVRDILAREKDGALERDGVTLDLRAMTPPHLENYSDPARIQEDIAALECDVRRYTGTLDAARNAALLRAEKAELETELDGLCRELDAYRTFCDEAYNESKWRDEQAGMEAQDRTIKERIAFQERRRAELNESEHRNESERNDVARRRATLQGEIKTLPRPAECAPAQPGVEAPADWNELIARYRRTHAEENSQAEQVREILEGIEKRTYGRYATGEESTTVAALREQIESIPLREKAVEEMWKGIAVGIKKDLQTIGKDLDTLKGLVGGVNRQLAAVNISNLASLKLLVSDSSHVVKQIHDIAVDDELPLFGDPKATQAAFEGIARLLADQPRIDLKDLFALSFEIEMPDGKTYRHAHLDAIESNGTTMAIKVLVNLVLMRSLLRRDEVQVPFYLDECSSLDQDNLRAIVDAAREMGFIAVLASPDAMDAADKLYFIEEQPDGRVVLDATTAMVRIRRNASETERPPDA